MRIIIPVLTLGILLSGCAAPTYQIGVNAYIKPGDSVRLAPPATFYVLGNKEAKDPALDREIKGKIDKLLGEQGHVLVPRDQAAYYVVFAYGQGPARPMTIPVPAYGGYWQPYAFAAVPYYAPLVQTVQDCWVLVNVIAAGSREEKGEFPRMWYGEARSSFTSGDLRSGINYLLVALFSQFAKSTRGARLVELEPGDFRVMQLGG